MGGSRLIARDFVGSDVEDEDIKLAARRRRHALVTGTAFTQDLPKALGSLRRRKAVSSVDDEEVGADEKVDETMASQVAAKIDEKSLPTPEPAHQEMYYPCPHAGRHVSFFSSPDSQAPTAVHSPAPTEHAFSPAATDFGFSRAPTETHIDPETPRVRSPAPRGVPPPPSWPRSRRVLRMVVSFLRSLCTPANLVVPISLVIALVTPLRSLFLLPTVPATLATYHISAAPDGGPPLSVLLDTADFIGAASVPLGLVCLGGALARLKAPRGREGWARMPLGAIGALAVLKTLLMPVLGVLICEGLTKVGVIDREDKVLRFVCM